MHQNRNIFLKRRSQNQVVLERLNSDLYGVTDMIKEQKLYDTIQIK